MSAIYRWIIGSIVSYLSRWEYLTYINGFNSLGESPSDSHIASGQLAVVLFGFVPKPLRFSSVWGAIFSSRNPLGGFFLYRNLARESIWLRVIIRDISNLAWRNLFLKRKIHGDNTIYFAIILLIGYFFQSVFLVIE